MTITEACEIIETKALSLTDGWVIAHRDYNKRDRNYDICRYSHPQLPDVEMRLVAPVGKPPSVTLLYGENSIVVSDASNGSVVAALVKLCEAANRAHDENELKLRHAPIIALAEKLSAP